MELAATGSPALGRASTCLPCPVPCGPPPLARHGTNDPFLQTGTGDRGAMSLPRLRTGDHGVHVGCPFSLVASLVQREATCHAVEGQRKGHKGRNECPSKGSDCAWGEDSPAMLEVAVVLASDSAVTCEVPGARSSR